MKRCLLALFALSPSLTMVGSDFPVLPFTDSKVELPPLGLSEYTKQMVAARIFGSAPIVSAFDPVERRSPAAKLGSRMPIIVPREGIDPSMVVKPDWKTVYKLTVKDPGVEPIK